MQLTDLTALEGLVQLQSLNLTSCMQLTDLSALEGLVQLQSLNLTSCMQLTDLSVLEGLERLQSLNLSWCRQLTDLSAIEGLKELQSLNLTGCEQLTVLSALEGLKQLQSLNLVGCWQLTDLSALKGLKQLRSLDLTECGQLTDLSALKGLVQLQSLDLSGCMQLTDLSALEGLKQLQSLNLVGCWQLTDLTALKGLKQLRSLNLSGCWQPTNLYMIMQLLLRMPGRLPLTDISILEGLVQLQSLDLSWNQQLTDLSPLEGLKQLQSLNLTACKQLTDLSALKGLKQLQSLNLSGYQKLTDLSVLEDLKQLQSLNLTGCEKVTDISALEGLRQLQSLNLYGYQQLTDLSVPEGLEQLQSLGLTKCRQLPELKSLRHLTAETLSNPELIFRHPRLVELRSNANDIDIKNIPAELLQGTQHTNVLKRIIPWQQEIIATGAAANSELKLFILGNGRVGKTQIARRLQGLEYNPAIPSTHGVELGRYRVLAAESEHPEIHLTLWDFGGQDIYLGTHGLFLDDRAVYVVAWHPDHENEQEFFENGIPMRNRPLAYWLAYIRSLAGDDAPIIVVQTQCDEEDEECPPPLPTGHGFTTLKNTACSARIEYGMERLVPEVRAAARLLRKRYAAVQVPQSWVDIEEVLRTRRGLGEKTLSFDEFATLCKSRHSLAHPTLIAGFLHRAGQVFWREGAFGNDLVLDQAWALQGIYALLERNDIVPLIRGNHGVFQLEQLQYRVWSEYEEREQRLFLDMMQQCGACFPLGNDRYVAVELLPSERFMENQIESVWRKADPDAQVELHYDFLHDGVIKNTLSHIGREAKEDGVYWRTGLCYYDREAPGAVLIRAVWDEGQRTTQRGHIEVWVEGPQASATARHLVESIQSIRIGKPTEIVWRRGQQKNEAPSEDAEQRRAEPFSRIAPEAKPGSVNKGEPLVIAPTTGQQNILLFATEWESRHGGLSTFNRELCLALGSMGKNVCCVVPAATAEEIAAAKTGHVQLICAPDGNTQRKLTLPDNFKPEIIIGHGRITGEAAKAQQEDHYPNAKRIHFVHMAPGQIEWHKPKEDAAQQAAAREQQELNLAKDADIVAAVGPLLLRECSTLIERLPAKERPPVCQFIPGFKPVDDERFRPSSLHCLLVGRAEDEKLKGIDIAARALQTIDHKWLPQQPELIIRGAPPSTATILSDNLTDRFTGLPRPRVRSYSSDVEVIAGDYRSAALTLMPSRCEGFGLVALESLRYGTPVLISNKSGLAELLCTFLKPHEQADYIVETPDNLEKAADNWREAILYQLRDTEAAIRRADKLRKILAEHFSWSGACKQLLAELVRVE